MEIAEDIVIVGAGLAGLATALGLHRKGVKSLVLESSPELRASGFAFTVWTNAWRALDILGIGDKIREHHMLAERFAVLSSSSGDVATEMSLEVQGKIGKQEVRCVRRDILLKTLESELPKETIRYTAKIVSIEENDNLKLIHLADGSVIKAKVLIGCDGVNSVVAKYLGLKKPSFSGRSATRGLAEYQTDHGFKPEFLQIIGGGFRAGLLPCNNQSIYWFFTWSSSKHEKVDENISKMRQFVITNLQRAKIPEQIIQVIEESEMSDVVSSPLRYRFPLSLMFGNITKGNICVTGDALHPMTPDLGQGGCLAIEDSVVLAKFLSEAILGGEKGDDKGEYERIKIGLEKYARNRRWRSIKVISLAYFVGFVQQSGNLFVSFLRDKLLAGVLAKILLRIPDYDCGKL